MCCRFVIDEVANDVVHILAHEILIAQDALDCLGDPAQTPRSLPVLACKIADGRRCDRIAHLELLDDHVLLRVMAAIRIVLEVVDDREDDLVIRAIAAVEHAQLPFKDAKQAFDIAMFLT